MHPPAHLPDMRPPAHIPDMRSPARSPDMRSPARVSQIVISIDNPLSEPISVCISSKLISKRLNMKSVWIRYWFPFKTHCASISNSKLKNWNQKNIWVLTERIIRNRYHPTSKSKNNFLEITGVMFLVAPIHQHARKGAWLKFGSCLQTLVFELIFHCFFWGWSH